MHGSIPSLTGVIDESAPVASIRTDGFGSGDSLEGLVCQITSCFSIGSIGCMDVNAPNVSLCIHCNLTASTLYLFAPMKAFGFCFIVGLYAL